MTGGFVVTVVVVAGFVLWLVKDSIWPIVEDEPDQIDVMEERLAGWDWPDGEQTRPVRPAARRAPVTPHSPRAGAPRPPLARPGTVASADHRAGVEERRVRAELYGRVNR